MLPNAFIVFRFVVFFKMSEKSSRNINRDMLNGILSTHIQFFHVNPSGRILNRFSKDLGAVDEFFPRISLYLGQLILSALGAAIMTTLKAPLALYPVIILCILYCILVYIFLNTSMDIKRLEGMSMISYLNPRM